MSSNDPDSILVELSAETEQLATNLVSLQNVILHQVSALGTLQRSVEEHAEFVDAYTSFIADTAEILKK
jgi:hypothetical protein